MLQEGGDVRREDGVLETENVARGTARDEGQAASEAGKKMKGGGQASRAE